jgi:hypothetical protein
VTATLLLVPALVLAQGKPKLTDQVKELSTKVDEALKAAAEGSAASKALQDLATKVTALQQQVAGLEQKSASFEAMRAKLEQYESRMGNLELDLAALKMQAGEKAAGAGFNDGFFIQSSDRKFLLRFGGLAQVGYTGQIFSDERLSTGESVGHDESTFLLKRARVSTSGHLLSWRLSYRLELDFGSVDPGPLLEGWGELHIHKIVRLRAGRQKIPFARQFIIHSAYQQFTERSGATQAFAGGWDLGAVLLGNIPIAGVISYQLGVFNGAGSEVLEDENTDFLYGARLLYQPLGPVSYAEGDTQVGKLQIAVGGAFTYNLRHTDIAERKGVTDAAKAAALRDADADGKIDNVGIQQLGAELVARLGGLAWQSELFYREEDPGAVDVERTFWGAYTQASFFHFSSSLELAARYGYWEPNYYGEDRTNVRPERIHELAVAVNGLIWRQRIKWQVQYSHRWLLDLKAGDKDLDGEVKVNTIQIQAQLAF